MEFLASRLDDTAIRALWRLLSLAIGALLVALAVAGGLALATWTVTDPSLTHATPEAARNLMGLPGAAFADPMMQLFGLAAPVLLLPPAVWGMRLAAGRPVGLTAFRPFGVLLALALLPAALASLPAPQAWPLAIGLGGAVGHAHAVFLERVLGVFSGPERIAYGALAAGFGVFFLARALAAPRERPRRERLETGGIRIRRAEADMGPAPAGVLFDPDEDGDFDEPEPRSRRAEFMGLIGHVALAARHRLFPARGRDRRRRDPGRRPPPAKRRAPRFTDEGPVAAGVSAAAASSRLKAALAASGAAEGADPRDHRVFARRAAAWRGDEAPPAARRPVPREAGCGEADLFETPEPPVAVDETDLAEGIGRAADALSGRRPARGPDPRAEMAPRPGSEQRSAPAPLHAATAAAGPEGDNEPPFDDEDDDGYSAEDFERIRDRRLGEFHNELFDADDDWDEDDRDDGDRDDGDRDDGDPGEEDRDEDHWDGETGEDGAPATAAPPRPDAAEAGRGGVLKVPTRGPLSVLRRKESRDAVPPPPPSETTRVVPPAPAMKPGRRIVREAQPSLLDPADYEMPPLHLLAAPPVDALGNDLTPEALEQNARILEGVLEDFGVRGEIINVRPGPVVTLYELEPAPGIKSSRVIGLADDIARSMSAISARVAVIPGKNAIGIELPNQKRVTVFLRELLASAAFEKAKSRLPLCLGKTIGGEAVIADLARMPHLLVAGTTGSGKSVSINTMILSLIYRLRPDQCRLIMIDPKMLELSIYDAIPHLLTPVVTDPKKAVVALKWAVREMEDRYRKMAKLGVRNIDGFNARLKEAGEKGERLTRLVQTGFDQETGEAIFEEETLSLQPLPYIVIIVDEMADLMLVAGKDIEGTIQRLAQMARAAGIHLIMATQRPSVDVITGTIKANFPTRISFQVTSKIDSRTILGEMGAEQLLGMGDMLYMAGGGRIQRVHGPFVSDGEVEDVVAHLKAQGSPAYLTEVTEDDGEPGEDGGGAGPAGTETLSESEDLYDRAVAVVLRDRKASTSYVQRRLSIGYNRAASLIERMEREGVVGPANHAGKREILVPAEEEVA